MQSWWFESADINSQGMHETNIMILNTVIVTAGDKLAGRLASCFGAQYVCVKCFKSLKLDCLPMEMSVNR